MTAQLNVDLLNDALTRKAESQNLSDRQVAKAVGVSASTVVRIRQNKQIGTGCLIAVLQWLGSPLEDFLTDPDTGLSVTAAANKDTALRNQISEFLRATADPRNGKSLESAIFEILDIALDHHEDVNSSIIDLPQMTVKRGLIDYSGIGWCAPSHTIRDPLAPTGRWDEDDNENDGVMVPAAVRKIAEIMGIEPSLLADTDNNPIWELITAEGAVSIRKWGKANHQAVATLILHEYIRRAQHAGEITTEEAEHRISTWRVWTSTSWGWQNVPQDGSGTFTLTTPESEQG